MNSICETDEYGNKYYYNICKKLHREDGPAIELCDGSIYWYINGLLNRENGPAIELCSGTKAWYTKGLSHREDGPACEYGHGTIDWYLNDEYIKPTNEMMSKYIQLNPDNILKNYRYPLEIQVLAISLKPSIIFDIKYPHKKLKELYPKLYALKKCGLI